MKRFAPLALAVLLLPGCVTLGQMKREVKQQVEAQKSQDEVRYQTTLTQVSIAIAALRERLVRFNQIDKDGNLIPLKAPAPAAPPAAAPAEKPAAAPPAAEKKGWFKK